MSLTGYILHQIGFSIFRNITLDQSVRHKNAKFSKALALAPYSTEVYDS